MKKIRLFKPSLSYQELNSVKKVFKKSWIGQGNEVLKFENNFRKKFKSNYSLAFNSCSAALHLALDSFKFKKGSKVMVNNLTFAASVQCILHCGLEPVLIDCDINTLGFNLEDAKRKYSKDVVAIIVVHYGGYPSEIDKILKFTKKRKLKLIEDCAHTQGTKYKGKILGTWGDIGCFSFEEKKGITTGDGGMLLTNNKKIYEEIKLKRWLGINKSTYLRNKNYLKPNFKKHWYYEIIRLGFKFHMNDLAASIGLAQLKKLNSFNKKKLLLIRKYNEFIEFNEKIRRLLPYNKNCSYWLYGIRYSSRDRLIEYLKSFGIECGVHFLPMSQQPLFKKYSNKLPISESVWRDFITLPLHYDMSISDVKYISNKINKFEKN
tara:strand:- start:62 stop:1192 length:1131 start_codon:yes stop_codon:yes gene_type:complete